MLLFCRYIFVNGEDINFRQNGVDEGKREKAERLRRKEVMGGIKREEGYGRCQQRGFERAS